jgi:hypothetical protein
LKIRAHPEGVEPLILGGERGTALWGENSACQHAAVGRLRTIKSLDYAGTVALLGEQLADGRKKFTQSRSSSCTACRAANAARVL